MELASEYQNRYEQIRVFDDLPTLSFHDKTAINEVGPFAAHLMKLLEDLDCSVELCGKGQLSSSDTRLIKLFARRQGAERANYSLLGSGASSARTIALELFDSNGSPCGSLFVKADSPEKTAKEMERFRRLVAPVLRIGTLPALIERLIFAERSAILYRFASEYDKNLFDALRQASVPAGLLIERLRTIEEPWFENTVPRKCTVEVIRRALVPDSELECLAEYMPARWKDAEALTVRVRQAVQHSDLHGENVLVADAGEVLLIDFTEVGTLCAPADAVMLELSVLFHPGAKGIVGAWPGERASAWPNLELYLKDCPIAEFVAACRSWAEDITERLSRQPIFALAYAYCVWQMKFESTDRTLARKIGEACVNQLLETP